MAIFLAILLITLGGGASTADAPCAAARSTWPGPPTTGHWSRGSRPTTSHPPVSSGTVILDITSFKRYSCYFLLFMSNSFFWNVN